MPNMPRPIHRRLFAAFLFAVSSFLMPSALLSEELDIKGTEPGQEPDGLFIVDGELTVVEVEGEKLLQIPPTPLVEGGTLFGSTLKGAVSVAATFKAERRGRSMPRFGVGVHGLSGFRLRVFPAGRKVELLLNEEPIASVPFSWTAGEDYQLELTVNRTSDAEDAPWKAEGRVWKAAEARPEAAILSQESSDTSARGKSSVWGTPYAGLPIYIKQASTESLEPASE